MRERPLTMNEVFLAKLVFVGSIAYHRVRIHSHGYVPFQPGDSGMTPNGEIYLKGISSPDFALDARPLKGIFIHEMAHVWQRQNGVLCPTWSAIGNSLRHGFRYTRAYRYTLNPSLDLLDYRMEQQAQIIEDYYWLFILGRNPPRPFVQNQETGDSLKQLYLAVLKQFLDNPGYAKSS